MFSIWKVGHFHQTDQHEKNKMQIWGLVISSLSRCWSLNVTDIHIILYIILYSNFTCFVNRRLKEVSRLCPGILCFCYENKRPTVDYILDLFTVCKNNERNLNPRQILKRPAQPSLDMFTNNESTCNCLWNAKLYQKVKHESIYS